MTKFVSNRLEHVKDIPEKQPVAFEDPLITSFGDSAPSITMA